MNKIDINEEEMIKINNCPKCFSDNCNTYKYSFVCFNCGHRIGTSLIFGFEERVKIMKSDFFKNCNKIKKFVLLRDKGLCWNCRCDKLLLFHHINPSARGGSDEANNLITTCSKCHSMIHSGLGWNYGYWVINLRALIKSRTPKN